MSAARETHPSLKFVHFVRPTENPEFVPILLSFSRDTLVMVMGDV